MNPFAAAPATPPQDTRPASGNGRLLLAGVVIDADDAALHLFGAARAELIGRAPAELCMQLPGVAGAVRHDSLETRMQAAAAGLPQSFVMQCAVPGHAPAWCLAELRPAAVAGQCELLLQAMLVTPYGAITTVDTSASARRIFDQAREMIYLRNRDGRFAFANATFLRWLGLEATQVIGRTDEELCHAADGPVYRSWHNDLEALEGGDARQYEEQISARGRRRTLLSIKLPVFNASGEIGSLLCVGSDISERKLMETALHDVALNITSVQGENVLRELARYVAAALQVDCALIGRVNGADVDVVGISDRGTDLETFAYPLAGTPCETVVGREFRMHTDDLAVHYPGDGLLHKFGFRSYAGMPLFDSSGAPIGILAVLHREPIGRPALVAALLKIYSVRAAAELERLHAGAALRASEEQYRSIFNASADALVLWNADMRIVDVNPAFERVYGASRAQVLGGAYPPTRVSAEYVELRREMVRRTLAGEHCTRELESMRQDGSRIHVEVRTIPIRHLGAPHVLAIMRDVTQRRLHEEEVQRNEARLRATIEAALDAVICMDLGGAIVEFNAAAECCFGAQRAEVLGKPLAELMVPARHRARYRASVARYLRSGRSPLLGRRVEIEAMRADGSEFPAELTVGVAQSREGPIFIAYVRDITGPKLAEQQRASLEEQLRQAQKMEAIGHLAGGIAHDFNNLLTSLTGYVAMAHERLAETGEQKAAQHLQKSLRSAERARNLVQQLLVFSRGQRGDPAAVDLGRHLVDFSELLRSTLPSSLVFSTDSAPGTPAVLVDPTQLDQVLMNLCINARDAMEARGAIRVGVRSRQLQGHVCASCSKPVSGSFVELSVSDTGTGIEPAVLECMFDPFYSTKRHGKGSGMGLSTTHGIVHDYGGHVLVDTHLGAGTTFRVLLPPLEGAVTGAAGALRQEHSAPGRDSLAGAVLLVDDDSHVLEFMEELLRSWDLEVHAFADPRRALAAVSAGEIAFDVAILDQTMPAFSGLELARALAELLPDPRTFLYTGYSDPISPAQLEKCSVLAVLQKPIDPARLHRLLSEQLRA